MLQEVPCRDQGPMDDSTGSGGCWPSHNCRRKVIDGLFTQEEVDQLVAIADKGLALRERHGGPTLVDINTGYIRDTNGLDNMFVKATDTFSPEDFLHYGSMIRRLQQAVMDTFGLSQLYFTAPTFITRIDADVPWQAQGVHDEYWHIHADRNNTAHYQYSGLLYLSTYEKDFTGGRLAFFPADVSVDDSGSPFSSADRSSVPQPDLIVHPRAGRVALFTSGSENPHMVEPVESGLRYVLSFWFTCDEKKQFEIFLDGKAHAVFSHKVRDSLLKSSKPKQPSKSDL